MYLHWSKKLAIGLLAVFGVLMLVLPTISSGGTSTLKVHTITWILLNYAGLVIWIFVWIGDQARMRGTPVWPWLVPLVLAPLPTLSVFLLYTLRRGQ